jgi:hypothetical protein
MSLAPSLHTAHSRRTAEVVAIAVLAQPPTLAGGLTGLATGRLGTILLPVNGAGIGKEKLLTTAAFTSFRRTAHREPKLRGARPARKSKSNAEEQPTEEGRTDLG